MSATSITSLVAPQLVFCPPQLGKPDPTLPRPITGPDMRPHIVQRGQKASECRYIVFNMLRNRWRAPNTIDMKERVFEHIVSAHRKAIRTHIESIPDILDTLFATERLVKEKFSPITKENVQHPQVQGLLRRLDSMGHPKVTLQSIIPQFLDQTRYNDLYNFLLFLRNKNREEITIRFLRSIGENPQPFYERAKRLYPEIYENNVYQGKSWDSLSPALKAPFLDLLTTQLLVRSYPLAASTWCPESPIESLMEQLQAKGPLAVCGQFGPSYYEDPPRQYDRFIAGRAIFGWNKTDRKQSQASEHMILLIGAEKTATRQFVYYITPEDESDPSHPEKQRVFVMSYEHLSSPDFIRPVPFFLKDEDPPTLVFAFHRK